MAAEEAIAAARSEADRYVAEKRKETDLLAANAATTSAAQVSSATSVILVDRLRFEADQKALSEAVDANKRKTKEDDEQREKQQRELEVLRLEREELERLVHEDAERRAYEEAEKKRLAKARRTYLGFDCGCICGSGENAVIVTATQKPVPAAAVGNRK